MTLGNPPQMLSAKLLFFEKPAIDPSPVLETLLRYFGQLDVQPAASLPIEAFQQNWHWKEANGTAGKCTYEILVTDFKTRTLEYKQRLDQFMKFLVAVTRTLQPQAIYSVSAQKLIDPAALLNSWDEQRRENLFGVVNVRLFRIGGKDWILMDTIGLSHFGLPDFQVLYFPTDESKIAQLLWNYAYYIFENGDVIKDGHTLPGLQPDSKWTCVKGMSLVRPEQVVINLQP